LDYAFDQLTKQLAPNLIYHNRDHTFEDVLPVATRLAERCAVTPHECTLIRLAAAFHDIGWTVRRHEHEAVGIEIVHEVLPHYGFLPDDIDLVAGMIQATHIPQQPRTLLEQIVADADLDSLGRDDFWSRTADLRAEMATFDEVMSDLEWYRYVLAFLENHHYFTAPAKAQRAAQKEHYKQELRQRIHALLVQPEEPAG
jgi:uncharacterized protein